MQTVKKGVWLDPVGMSHTLDHIWTSAVVLIIFSIFYPIPILTIPVVILIEGIYHYLIDYTKVRYGCKDSTKPLFWNQFGLDQLAHQFSYLVIAWYLLIL
jgi:hypothetical protein